MKPENEIELLNTNKDKILKERARILKIEFETEILSDKIMDGLEFVLADENYIIDATCVSEVLPIKDITPLPCTPKFILGIINVRGKIIAIVDIKKFFNLPEKGITNLNKVILVNHNGIELGIITDEVLGHVQVFNSQLQSKIASITDVENNFIIGITKNREIVIDVKQFLNSEKLIINDKV